MRYHQISSVAVSVELTEFLDNIFKIPIFKSKFNFFEILKAKHGVFGAIVGSILSKAMIVLAHVSINFDHISC